MQTGFASVELLAVVQEMHKEHIVIPVITPVSVLHPLHCVPRQRLVLEVLANVVRQALV